MIDFTQVIVAIIGLLAAIVTTVAVPWLRAKLGEKRWEQLEAIARVAVQAAEQLNKTKGEEEHKDNRLAYATERVKAALAKANITYDDATIRAAIEAEVLKLDWLV